MTMTLELTVSETKAGRRQSAAQQRRALVVAAAEIAISAGKDGRDLAGELGMVWDRIREDLRMVRRSDLVEALRPRCRRVNVRLQQQQERQQARQRHLDELIEDVEWMLHGRESLTGAARRLGRTGDSLEQALVRAGRADLFRQLRANEPLVLSRRAA